MLITAVAIDGLLLAAIELAAGRDGGGAEPRALDAGATVAIVDGGAAAPRWAICLPGEAGEAPQIAAITYLDTGRDAAVNAPEIRGWFGELDPTTIQIWRLEQIDGKRRVSFELPAASWPRWSELAAGLTGAALCDALRRELVAQQVGRPRTAADATATDRETRSRHDLEFFFTRRERLYRSRIAMGSLADLTQPRLDELRAWIDDALTGAPP